MKAHLTNVQIAFCEVFANTGYIAFASVLAIFVFMFAVLLPNFGLITEVLGTANTPLAIKLQIVWSLLGGIRTNFSTLSAGYTIAIASLFGINTAMIVYFLKRARTDLAPGDAAAGFGGIASGVLGIGCAACGSFILSAILPALGAAGALAILPLHGGEFGLLSVILLAISLFLISKKIADPLHCVVQ